ncbi:MAG: hypothetical protein ACE5R6_18960 [Candidatus Heimdallarchaeota archaeon]
MAENLEANTAKTYAVVGLVFYILSFIGILSGIITANWWFSWTDIPWRGPWGLSPSIPALIILGIGLYLVVHLFLLIWAYLTYKKIMIGDYIGARTVTLLLGIFGLFPFLGLFIGGIFFIFTYVQLGDVLRMAQRAMYTPIQAHASDKSCASCGQVVGINEKFCPRCGAKLCL